MIKQYKNPETKKTLVRNTSTAMLGKNVTLVAPSTKPSSSKVSSIGSQMSKLSLETDCDSNLVSKGSVHCTHPKKAISRTKFNTPDLQSTLKFSKKIDEVVNPLRTKSSSSVGKTRLAIDEKVNKRIKYKNQNRKAVFYRLLGVIIKCIELPNLEVSRKVNQPLYKPVFKDLISISSYEPKSQKVLPVRPPKPPKDPEPKLEDFLEVKKVKHFVSVPKVNVLSFLNNPSMAKDHQNSHLRLYSLLQVHNETKVKMNNESESI